MPRSSRPTRASRSRPSRRATRAARAQAAQDHPGAEIAGSPEELLAQRLDLVVLASPAHVHLEQGLAALASGAALVIDKPFAASVAEAEQLVAAADPRPNGVMVFQNRRWDGGFLAVRKLIRERERSGKSASLRVDLRALVAGG